MVRAAIRHDRESRAVMKRGNTSHRASNSDKSNLRHDRSHGESGTTPTNTRGILGSTTTARTT